MTSEPTQLWMHVLLDAIEAMTRHRIVSCHLSVIAIQQYTAATSIYQKHLVQERKQFFRHQH
jgi:hypothetical protein